MTHVAAIFAFVLISSVMSFSYAYAEEANVKVALEYPDGDRASLARSILVISSEDESVTKEIPGKAGSTHFEVDLPLDKRYQMTVFVNDMLVAVHYVYLSSEQIITIPIPTSAGLKFEVYYNDGNTPIESANVQLFSHKGNMIREGITDLEGKTLRFWLAPTPHKDDYYQPQVLLGDSLAHKLEPLKVESGSTDVKIVTPWPPSVDFLRVSAYEDDVTKLRNWGDGFVAELEDSQGESIVSKFNRGDALFTNLRVGQYELTIRHADRDTVLTNETVALSQKTNHLDVVIPNTKESEGTNIQQDSDAHNSDHSEGPSALESFDEEHYWKKQSSGGLQSTKSENSHTFIELSTEGENNPVFSRSQIFGPIDLTDKVIEIALNVDRPTKLTELWFTISSDGFSSSWHTSKIDVDSLVANQWNKVRITLKPSEMTGSTDLSQINMLQIRIRDNGTESVNVKIDELKVIEEKLTSSKSKTSCNCVAFRLDDLQDFWLNKVQIEVMDTFKETNSVLTVGIIGNKFGQDMMIRNYIEKNIRNDDFLELANHGWDHEDFAQYDSVVQEVLLTKTNSKIREMFGIKPTVFIPPFNSYNSETIVAMKKVGMTHYSSELDFSTPPFHLSGKNVYNFPETAMTGAMTQDRTYFVGLSHSETMKQIEASISEYGFAVVTLHPQEYAIYYQGDYHNQVNYAQIEQLKILISELQDAEISIVPISEISIKPNDEGVPGWVKNSAKWWSEEKITTKDFIDSLEFLIKKGIVKLPPTEKLGETKEVPDWIKASAKWWYEGKISDAEFIHSTQFLVRNGIIRI